MASTHREFDGQWLLYESVGQASGPHKSVLTRMPLGGGEAQMVLIENDPFGLRCSAKLGTACILVRRRHDEVAVSLFDTIKGVKTEVVPTMTLPTSHLTVNTSRSCSGEIRTIESASPVYMARRRELSPCRARSLSNHRNGVLRVPVFLQLTGSLQPQHRDHFMSVSMVQLTF
jgi:hypothetical protein